MTVTDTPGSVLLTGPTGGLGRALLEPLARRHPEHLILLGRTRSALEDAARTARQAGAQSVSVIEADMADLDAVARAGQAITDLIAKGRPPLTSLVLNAGLQLGARTHVSAQGVELTFAVNVVAPHLLLRATGAASAPGVHVVAVGSGTHYGDWHSYGMVPAPRWQDPVLLARPDSDDAPADPQGGPRAYATSKLAVLHLAHAWQAHHDEHHDRARVNVFDPGLMPGTGLGRELTGPALWAWKHAMPTLTFLPGWSTPQRSASLLASFALGETHRDLAGGYVELGRSKPSSPASNDLDAQQRLWTVCEDLTAPHVTGPVVTAGGN